jgi:hypothetical protein
MELFSDMLGDRPDPVLPCIQPGPFNRVYPFSGVKLHWIGV